jgi:hypothetical protein
MCWDFWRLQTKVSRTRSTVSADGPGRPVRFALHRQPVCWNFLYHSRIVLSVEWFCVILGPKRSLHRHNWLSFGKFQDTERFLIVCPRHVSSRLIPSGETCKHAMAPATQTNLERFCTYWYARLCCVYLGCCAAEFGSSGGTDELPWVWNCHFRFLQLYQADNERKATAKLLRLRNWLFPTLSNILLMGAVNLRN